MTLAESVTGGELKPALSPYSGLAMRSIQLTCGLIFLAASSLPLRAANSVTLDWDRICRKVDDYKIIATTITGDTVAGYCLNVTATELSVQTSGQQVVKIARGNVAKIQMHRQKGHLLRSLFIETGSGVLFGAVVLFKHDPVIGIVWIPAALVWGAVRLPFYAAADLVHLGDGDTEIKVR